ncbi:leucine-rich repeat domain-containing protein [Candidatus Poriferisocius sp.]|uniref:leucine-rich repeat domain-containing protein n=1 Tax=Candidatus Poriferisocius sp. TaxID=3101276 RepID=UPI003B01E435
MPGAVWLEWDDTAGASGYEVMWRSPDGWALLSEREPAGGVAVELDGPSAVVAGLPQDQGSYWFAVRARNPWGLSEWSESFEVAVPAFAAEPDAAEPVFDPFTAPTRSGIDLERLGQAAATITPGRADCEAAPALDVGGITIVAPPADLGDPDAELTVAEVVRIAGGCLLVEYADLAGRTIGQVRDLLASDPTVFAVDEPIRSIVPDHDTNDPAYTHPPPPKNMPDKTDQTGHYDDTEKDREPSGPCCGQWHLTPDITGEFELDRQGNVRVAKNGLWQGWVVANPVTVAVLDEFVDVRHPDLVGRVGAGLGGCHADPGAPEEKHGTYVAGIVAAEAGNDVGVAGVAPSAGLLPVRMIPGGACLTATAAVAAAVNAGARVINMSFRLNTGERDGVDVGGVPTGSKGEDSFEAALRAASMLGVVPVTSAGNCGDDSDETRNKEVDGVTQKVTKKRWEWVDCPEHNFVQSPSVYQDVISVAAVKHGGYRLEMSSVNTLVDIAAPGDLIRSTEKCTAANSCGTETRSGTSAAAPFVSGVVAHMLNRHPEATVGQVRAALERSANHISQPPSPQDAARWTPRRRAGDPAAGPPSKEFGHGIVDPAWAVDELGKILGAQRVPEHLGGFSSVAAGGAFSCGLFANKAVRCWGDGDLVAAVPVGQAFSQISAPVGLLGFGCGLRPLGPGDERGTVLCWSGADSRVARFAPQGAFTQIAAGQSHTCGLRPGGEAVCWHNKTGVRMAAVPSGEFEKLSGGWNHWCALRDNYTAVCWGDDDYDDNDDYGQARVPAGALFKDISAGGRHTCGVTNLTGVLCWGDAAAIAGMPASLGFQSLDAGFAHTCGMRNETQTILPGSEHAVAVCWGYNGYGQADAPAGSFAEVSAGFAHTCGLVASRIGHPTGGVRCWGDHSFGRGSTAALRDLSLTSPAGKELLGPVFNTNKADYVAETPRGTGTLTAQKAAASDVVRIFPGDADAGAPGHQVRLPSDEVITITVESLWGYGEQRAYRIHTIESPRLESLRIYGPGYGTVCLAAGSCAELELDPAFDSETGYYRATAPAHWNQITVSLTATGGGATTTPPDADPDTPGHQIALSTDRGFTQISSGSYHTCGIKTDQTAACWDKRFSWQSHGRSDAPPGSFTQVSAGRDHTCGIKDDQSAVCWGLGHLGQTDAPPGKFTAVSAGRDHTCGIKTDQSAVCWGSNGSGQTDAPPGKFTAVSAGRDHTCGIKTDQSAVCWGSNGSGQADAPPGKFTAVSAGSSHSCGIKTDQSAVCWGIGGSRSAAPAGRFTSVSAGSSHSCGIKADQSAVCWGWNPNGETDAPAGEFTAVSAGWAHTCGIKTDSAVMCWGDDDWGQQDAPSGPLASIAAGNEHSCGIRAGGSAVCWGGNNDGQSDAPAGEFTAVSAGGVHSCAIKADQSAVCWGSNRHGQSDAPPGKFTAISAGSSHSCAIKASDSGVVCWGSNRSGQTDAPAGEFTSVSAGSSHTCGIKADQSAVCWGWNPNGETDAPAGEFTAVSAGSSHTCGIKADQSAVCWGPNTIGGLSYGRLTAPTGEFTAVSAGRYHSCGIKTDQSAVCWGDHDSGKLAAPAGKFTTVAAGKDHSCGIKADQAAVCWGARSRTLEPAKRHIVTIRVRPQVPAAISRLGVGTAASYVVSVVRPRPPRPQTSSPASNSQTTGAGGGSGSVGGQAEDSEAGAEQQHLLEEQQRFEEEQQRLLDRQEEPRGYIPPARAYPLADTVSGPPGAGAPQQGGAPGAVAGPGGGGFACPGAVGGAEAVAVGDAVLRAGIERALGKAAGEAVTAAELGALGELSLPAGGLSSASGGGRVSDLSGLEHASGLRVLDLYGHDVADLEPLSCLESLAAVELGANRISDVSPLRGLTGLTALGLGGNDFSDVSALSGLVGLRSLRLHANEVSDVSALSGLSGLAGLDVSFNEVSDVSPLRGLSGLTSLGLGGNRIADVSALGGLSALGALYVFDNDIADTSPLAGLSGLRSLWADGNRIAAANTLGGLSGLGYLDVRYNLIADTSPLDALTSTVHARPQSLAPSLIADASLLAAVRNALGLRPDQHPTAGQLAGLETLKRAARRNDPAPIRSLDGLQHATALRTLELPGNHITDLAPISALAQLRELDLQSNRVQSLAPLAGLSRLEHLNLILNDLADIADLPPLPRLETLFIDINRIQSLEPLRNRTQLQRLSASSNQITDLEPIAGLTNLKRLTLSHNNIANISPLSGLTQLAILRLTLNNITDIAPLAGLQQLTHLRLSHNNIKNIAPIATLPRLWFLHITHNPIADTTPLNNHPTLKFLYT